MPGVEAEPLLRVVDLVKEFGRPGRGVRAVDKVSFDVTAGECLAIVGESGSGKSTLARTLLRLIEPTDGDVVFRGESLIRLSERGIRAQRRRLQMIFQDPYASLHPRETVEEIISEPWKVHPGIVARKDRGHRVRELLGQVGLPEGYATLYPSRLSGGERQRVAIARALALRPDLLVLDEPVSALDVSIQAQVINVLMSLHDELSMAYIFISHDLALVRLVSDRVAVMYMGRFVEIGTADDLYKNPQHPYTRALLATSPSFGSGELDLDEEPVSERVGPAATEGCRYRNRCPLAEQICQEIDPELLPVGTDQHQVACHLSDRGDPSGEPAAGPRVPRSPTRDRL